jgi:ketosteroid isomerase-like protein
MNPISIASSSRYICAAVEATPQMSPPALNAAVYSAGRTMWKPDPQGAKQMTESDDVLSANLEFYRAFTARDFSAMEALWARQLPVSCIHPGWGVLHDRASIVQSWRDILGNPEAPRVACHDEQAALYGDVAIVTCEEALSSTTLIATNIYAKEDGAWRIVHHQAGPLVMHETPRRMPPPSRLH